jgi:hypothetical protein
MKLFWKALHSNLVANATLVSLCDYQVSPPKPTITRADFQTADYSKGIYFQEAPGSPYVFGSDSVELQEWVVDFTIVAPTLTEMSDIAAEFTSLFDQSPNSFSYWNFSNDDIYVQSTSIIDIVGGKHNDERNVWHCVYSVRVKWSYC